jgi:hypothetical protein
MSTAHCGEGRNNKMTHLITVTILVKDGDAPAAILYDEKGGRCHGKETRCTQVLTLYTQITYVLSLLLISKNS